MLSLNVFFTLFFGLLAIYLYDFVLKLFERNSPKTSIALENSISKGISSKLNKETLFSVISKILGFIIVILIAYIAKLLHTDYGFWGVLLIFIFYLFRTKRLLMSIVFLLLCIAKYLVSFINSGYNLIFVVLALFTFLPIIFITSYNGKQGPKLKYLLYVFYPLHLLILYLL